MGRRLRQAACPTGTARLCPSGVGHGSPVAPDTDSPDAIARRSSASACLSASAGLTKPMNTFSPQTCRTFRPRWIDVLAHQSHIEPDVFGLAVVDGEKVMGVVIDEPGRDVFGRLGMVVPQEHLGILPPIFRLRPHAPKSSVRTPRSIGSIAPIAKAEAAPSRSTSGTCTPASALSCLSASLIVVMPKLRTWSTLW